MFELWLIAVALIGTGIAGYWDLKTTNVPDLLIIGMIAIGFIIHAITGFSTGNFSSLTNALIYGGLFLGFGLIMYFTGQWGGGDGETLVAIGVLVPTTTYVTTLFPFSISYFINLIFVGAIYSIVYAIYLASKNPKIIKDFYKKILKNEKVIFSITIISILPVIFYTELFFFPVLIFLFLIFYYFAKTIEKGFYKKIPVSKLRLDDMIGEDIPKLKIYKRYLRGLTKQEVRKIKRMKRYVMIREGVKFTPVFFLTLIFTLLLGDFLFLLI